MQQKIYWGLARHCIVGLTMGFAALGAWAQTRTLTPVPAPVQASGATGDDLIWSVIHYPPTAILSGTQEGQGFTDKARKLFMKSLPQYHHVVIEANYARLQMELRSRPNVCSPAILRLPEREAFMLFSDPYLSAMPYLAISLRGRDELGAFKTASGQLRLPDLLADGRFRVGVPGGRSLGSNYDKMLKAAPANGSLVVRHGNPGVAGLLRMLLDRKVDLIIGFPTELNYAAGEMGVTIDQLSLTAVAGGDDATPLRVGCSKSETGERVIRRVNELIKSQRREIEEYYLAWLPPELAAARRKAGGQGD
ncbi:TIGR02285 family protein [Roseateles koreensis]|uniref:TIGR02285 family protein n=1 Tax=Roseateles koreensis TaxID=2987526 RepID=A0ABT5KPB7_9BURK|nr:TIGR02285 family protein [Roseateles koreensis]MDC8784707.1 TIGR02285 family protein [Roseateles koreensis]